jgi:Transposase DDE domain
MARQKKVKEARRQPRERTTINLENYGYPGITLPRDISAPDYLSVIWQTITPAFCQEVFEITRDRERQRKWTLYALLKTWIGLLQTDLSSQTEAIEECCGKGHPLFPLVEATPESFFLRIQSLRPAFFRNIFTQFTQSILPEFPANFQQDLGISIKKFPEIYAVDGSRLEKVGRLLKIARSTSKAIIPGSMEGVYDMRRGCLRELWFDPDGARSEIAMFDEVLESIPSGSLLVNDRYYPKPVIWNKVGARGISMVCRYNATVGKRKIKVFRRVRNKKMKLDDWLVEMGGSQSGQKPVLLRWVRVRCSDGDITLVTNVLDPQVISAEQLVELYAERWTVERMYLHLKEVLALNELFNASPAAVGQQTYATAILYNALRLSQAKIAKKLKIEPEILSPDKLFPRVIEKVVQMTFYALGAENQTEKILHANRGRKLKLPAAEVPDHPMFRVSLVGVLVQKRAGRRKKRRFCKGRRKWTTYKKIPGARRYLKN